MVVSLTDTNFVTFFWRILCLRLNVLTHLSEDLNSKSGNWLSAASSHCCRFLVVTCWLQCRASTKWSYVQVSIVFYSSLWVLPLLMWSFQTFKSRIYSKRCALFDSLQIPLWMCFCKINYHYFVIEWKEIWIFYHFFFHLVRSHRLAKWNPRLLYIQLLRRLLWNKSTDCRTETNTLIKRPRLSRGFWLKFECVLRLLPRNFLMRSHRRRPKDVKYNPAPFSIAVLTLRCGGYQRQASVLILPMFQAH